MFLQVFGMSVCVCVFVCVCEHVCVLMFYVLVFSVFRVCLFGCCVLRPFVGVFYDILKWTLCVCVCV